MHLIRWRTIVFTICLRRSVLYKLKLHRLGISRFKISLSAPLASEPLHVYASCASDRSAAPAIIQATDPGINKATGGMETAKRKPMQPQVRCCIQQNLLV